MEKKMIVIRNLDSSGNECDQEIYCDIACFSVVRFRDEITESEEVGIINQEIIESSYEALNQIAESEQFNDYENEHIIPNSHYPTIEDFLSVDSQEYCYSCGYGLGTW